MGLLASGCLTGGNAPTAAGTAAPRTEAAPDVVPVAGSVASAGGGGVIGAGSDPERVTTDLAGLHALYGPNYAPTDMIAPEGTPPPLTIPPDGRLDLGLRVRWPVADRGPDDPLFHEDVSGPQVRLILIPEGETDATRFRWVDAKMAGLQPQGHNVFFSGLNLVPGRLLVYLYYKPSAEGAAFESTAATYDALTPVPGAEAYNGFLADAATYPVGSFPLQATAMFYMNPGLDAATPPVPVDPAILMPLPDFGR